MKINSPCLNCENRIIPKTCEKDCALWLEYRKELSKAHNIIKLKKWGGIYG